MLTSENPQMRNTWKELSLISEIEKAKKYFDLQLLFGNAHNTSIIKYKYRYLMLEYVRVSTCIFLHIYDNVSVFWEKVIHKQISSF